MRMQETITPKRPRFDHEPHYDAMQIDIPHELVVIWDRLSGE